MVIVMGMVDLNNTTKSIDSALHSLFAMGSAAERMSLNSRKSFIFYLKSYIPSTDCLLMKQ